MTAVVDASVVLAWLQDEPGSDDAESHLMEGIINAVNWSEVYQKVRRTGVDAELAARMLSSFGLAVIDVTRADGETAADLWEGGSALSLADRLCMATALRLHAPAVTMDNAWAPHPRGPDVVLLRG